MLRSVYFLFQYSQSDPPMISIPDTAKEIMALPDWKSRHRGLLRAMESSSNGRSPKNAYILLLGLTGAGKSSTVSNSNYYCKFDN